jgi:hypothetical protein
VTPPAERQGLAALARVFSGKIDSINTGARTMVVKQDEGPLQFVVSFRDDSTVVMPTGKTSRLDDAVDQANGKMPFAVGNGVLVTWKQSTDGKKTIATRIEIKK